MSTPPTTSSSSRIMTRDDEVCVYNNNSSEDEPPSSPKPESTHRDHVKIVTGFTTNREEDDDDAGLIRNEDSFGASSPCFAELSIPDNDDNLLVKDAEPSEIPLPFSESINKSARNCSQEENQRPVAFAESPVATSRAGNDDSGDFYYSKEDKLTSTRKATADSTFHHSSSSIMSLPSASRWRQCTRTWSGLVLWLRIQFCSGINLWSHKAALYPWTTVMLTLVVSFGMAGIGMLTNFRIEVDSQILFPPTNAIQTKYHNWIVTESGFPRDPSYFFVIIHADGANVLSREGVSRSFQALDTIRGTPGYEQVCGNPYQPYRRSRSRRRKALCPIHGVVKFWNESTTLFQEQVQTEEAVIRILSGTEYPDTAPVDRDRIFGNFETHDASSESNSTLSVTQAHMLQIDFPPTKAADEVELEILDRLDILRRDWMEEKGNIYRLEYYGSQSLDIESNRAVYEDVALMPIGFCIMAFFNFFIYSKNDKIKSQSLLGVGAVVAVVLSIMTSYGLMFAIGIPMNAGAQLIVFVMFGIGVDDALIITGSFRRKDPNRDAVERMDETIQDIGLSIGLTTLTSALAFAFGCLSTIPYIYYLCYYAIPAVVVVFFYQTTFFVALTIIDERRMESKRMDCLVCWSPSDTSNTALCRRITCKSRENDELQGSEQQVDETTVEPEETGFATDRIMRWYAHNLLRPWVKAAVIIFFAALLGFFAYSTTKHRQSMGYRNVVPENSYVIGYYDAQENYCSNSGNLAGFLYFRHADQSLPEVQAQMGSFVYDLVESGALSETPKYFWLRHFHIFVNNLKENELTTDWANNATFTEQLDAFLSNPVFAMMYGDQIVRDPANGDITASRCLMFLDANLRDIREQIALLKLFRKVDLSQPINHDISGPGNAAFFSFSTLFFQSFEFYNVLADELIFTTISAIAAVSLVALFFIQHWTAVFYVFACMATLYIDLLGFLQVTGVSINPISYIILVMSIGLMVDFLVHMFIRYYEVQGTRTEKVTKSLTSMGSSILLGGVSTLLGVLMLAFSVSYGFRIIFRAFLGLVVLGLSYGLVLLPVVLSLIGPEDV